MCDCSVRLDAGNVCLGCCHSTLKLDLADTYLPALQLSTLPPTTQPDANRCAALSLSLPHSGSGDDGKLPLERAFDNPPLPPRATEFDIPPPSPSRTHPPTPTRDASAVILRALALFLKRTAHAICWHRCPWQANHCGLGVGKSNFLLVSLSTSMLAMLTAWKIIPRASSETMPA